MNGTNAQFVSLTCHGNAFLRGLPANRFFPANSTCQFCERVTFVELSKPFFGKPKETEVASTPDEWFGYLKRTLARGVKLVSSPRNDPNLSDRMSAGFVGGGEAWSMEVVHANGRSVYWRSRWEVGDQNAPNRRIWRVTYGRVSDSKTYAVSPDGLASIEDKLQAALQEIHEFARRNNCGGFTDCFARALAVLAGSSVDQRAYHQDLSPTGILSSEAVRILDACQHAWVFGGMGSWNDMGFDGEDGKVYDQVSERLFRAINEAIPASANNSFLVG